MHDLVGFLRARYDEDADATRRHWHKDGFTSQEFHGTPYDPARIMAEIDAKRRIIAEHGPPRPSQRDYACASNCADRMGLVQERPCPTLRLLAAPYAGHADYRAEWAP